MLNLSNKAWVIVWKSLRLKQASRIIDDETSTPLFKRCVMQRRTGSSALSALPVCSKAGEICFISTNRKSYFQSLISADSANSVNSFDNSINTQFYMFLSAPKQVKLVSHKCLTLSSMLHPAIILPDFNQGG